MKPSIYLTAAFAALNIVFFYLTLVSGHTCLYEENHVIENIQAGAMILAFAGLAGISVPRTGFTKWLTLFFAATCLTMFLREVDVEDLNVAEAVKWIGSGLGRDLILGISFLALGIHFIRHHRSLVGEAKNLLRSRVAALSIIGCILLVFGGIFEELDMQLLEEMVEMNGALLILLAAVLFMKDPAHLTGKCTEELIRR